MTNLIEEMLTLFRKQIELQRRIDKSLDTISSTLKKVTEKETAIHVDDGKKEKSA